VSTTPVNPVDTQDVAVDTNAMSEGSNDERLLTAAAKTTRSKLIWASIAALGLLIAFLAGSSFRGGEELPDDSLKQELPPPEQGKPAKLDTELKPNPPAPVLDATLIVTHKNRLSLAYISLWVDGDRVWTEELTAPKNVFKRVKRISGLPVEKAIPVSAGSHTIEVHISGKSKKIEAMSSIKGDFKSEQIRRLKIGLNPYSKKIKMSWES
jgi:hypothetical protein